MKYGATDDMERENAVLPAGLVHPTERQLCVESLRLLRDLLTDRSLVFFVGAGVSRAEPTRCPVASELLEVVFAQILLRLGQDGDANSDSPTGQRLARLSEEAANALPSVARRVGLEATLGELRQIWEPAFRRVLQTWADLSRTLPFNPSHEALAAWMREGGTVITTNYDCFIEEAYYHLEGRYPEARYWTSHELPPDGLRSTFHTWSADLARGGVFFKLHGSFDDLDTCLATMDQVGTEITGYRADLLRYVFSKRPICVVGWRGVDPDIPPVIASTRSPTASAPLVWILHDGAQPEEPFRLGERLSQVPSLLSNIASENPLVSEANRLFTSLQDRMGPAISRPPEGGGTPLEARDQVFQGIALDMPATAAARFLGIVCRRGGELQLARNFESAATALAENRIQWAAGLQEQAHVLWQRGEHERAARDVARVSRELAGTSDIAARLTADFGDLSMTMVNLRTHPTGGLRLFPLFRRYRRDIDAFAKASCETKEVHLHRALFHLYRGRLRLLLVRSLARPVSGLLSSYVLGDFRRAKDHIGQAGGIHIHSTVDVLSYGALALARFGRCEEAWQDFFEAERLAQALGDVARWRHLRGQRERLEGLCGVGPGLI